MKPKGLPLVLGLSAASAAAQVPAIDHTPVACVWADRYSEITARLVPFSETVPVAVRVYFRAADASSWSYLELTPGPGGAVVGALPKPDARSREITYYLQAMDPGGIVRTPEYLAAVVARPELCTDPGRLAKAAEVPTPNVQKGPPVALASVSRSGNAKWILLGALGAGAAGAGIAVATHSSVSQPATIPSGIYSGPLDAFTQETQSSTEGGCFFMFTTEPGTITLTIGPGSASSGSFSFRGGSLVGGGPNCNGSPMPAPLSGAFESLLVQGTSISGTVVVGSWTFALVGRLIDNSLRGTLSVSGGAPSLTWSVARALFNASRSP